MLTARELCDHSLRDQHNYNYGTTEYKRKYLINRPGLSILMDI